VSCVTESGLGPEKGIVRGEDALIMARALTRPER
jgi:hypothetical protein